MRIEGSQGQPEREFNGPVIGLQERYRRRAGRPGPPTSPRPTSEQRVAGCASDEDFCELLWQQHCCEEGMYEKRPQYGGNRDAVG